MTDVSVRIRITRTVNERELARQIIPAVDNLSGNIMSRMKRLVPKRSFRLRDSMRRNQARLIGGKIVGGVSVGGKIVRGKYVGYHLLVERGTSRMRAQPYIRPALYQSRSSDLVTQVVDR